MQHKRSFAAYPLLRRASDGWLIFFFIPMAAMFKKSLETLHVNADYSQTYTFDWNWSNYTDASRSTTSSSSGRSSTRRSRPCWRS